MRPFSTPQTPHFYVDLFSSFFFLGGRDTPKSVLLFFWRRGGESDARHPLGARVCHPPAQKQTTEREKTRDKEPPPFLHQHGACAQCKTTTPSPNAHGKKIEEGGGGGGWRCFFLSLLTLASGVSSSFRPPMSAATALLPAHRRAAWLTGRFMSTLPVRRRKGGGRRNKGQLARECALSLTFPSPPPPSASSTPSTCPPPSPSSTSPPGTACRTNPPPCRRRSRWG